MTSRSARITGTIEGDDMTQAMRFIDSAAAASRRDSFIESYWPTISDEDALGVAISKWAEWEGNKIMETFASALEDSNYHTERAEILDLWNSRNGTDLR